MRTVAFGPKPFKNIALIGPNMKTVAFCGGGSASLHTYYTISPYEGIVDQLPQDVEVLYQPGVNAYAFTPEISAADIRTITGGPGLRMRLYRDPPSVPNRPVIDKAILSESSWHLMGFSQF